jgi:hypothetical protein
MEYSALAYGKTEKEQSGLMIKMAGKSDNKLIYT